MHGHPDVEEVTKVASSLGMTLAPDEALLYCQQVKSRLEGIDRYMAEVLEEEHPTLLAPDRKPGHAPSAGEDPLNAWLWKCEIGATSEGPLAGKTVSFKDHIAVAGMPLTLGSRLMEGFIPDFDATVVTRVLAAGGTIIGKNSMSGPTSSWGDGIPGDYERPLNPHRTSHITGGSSSGSAAAVAAREVDVAFGGDQGGSIRIPAAYCGIYGMKPTFGLVSHFGIAFGSDPSLDHTGPMARHAEDVAAALDAVAGYDGLDPRQDRTVPLGMDAMSTLDHGVKGVRIGFLEEGFVDADPDVAAAVRAAIDVLATLGADVCSISVPEHHTSALSKNMLDLEGQRAIFDVGFFGAFARTYYPAAYMAAAYTMCREHPDRLKPGWKLRLILGEFVRRRFRGGLYAKAQNARNALKRAIDRALDRVDALVMPTCLEVAPEYVAPADHLAAELARKLRNTNVSPYNFTGHPALSVPCGKSHELPIGLQLVGRYYADALLLRVAYAFENSVDWARVIGPPGSMGSAMRSGED